MLLGVVIWFILVIATGALASNKGRSVFGWVALAVLVAPLCILILAALPNLRREREEGIRHREVVAAIAHADAQPDTRDCPHCAETIKAAAKVCKHCGRDVEPILPRAAATEDDLASLYGPAKCPTCGAYQNLGAAKCHSCGETFPARTEKLAVTPSRCPECRAYQKPGAQTCPACGCDFKTALLSRQSADG